MDPSENDSASRPSRIGRPLPVALLGSLAVACLLILDVPPALRFAAGLTTVASLVRAAIGKVSIHRHAIAAGERRQAQVGDVCALPLPAAGDAAGAGTPRRRKCDRHLTLQLWIGPVLWEVCCKEIPIVR